MGAPPATIVGLLLSWARNLRFPWLFALAGLLFLFDLLVPDLIPLVDEILLGLATLMIGSFKRERKASALSDPLGAREEGPVIDVEPEPAEEPRKT